METVDERCLEDVVCVADEMYYAEWCFCYLEYTSIHINVFDKIIKVINTKAAQTSSSKMIMNFNQLT